MKIHQASFTRVGGQGTCDGWQTVNVSPGAPADAVASFSRFQSSNVHDPEFDEEDKGEKIVTELQADGNCVFLTRIKYGLKDQLGRPSMFANSFFIGINEFARNPQAVLGIKGENFRFDVESTKPDAHEVLLSEKLSLTAAAESIGLSREMHLVLARCVLHAQGISTKAALHLICDCAEETVRYAMFCICMSVPYSFRRIMSFSTCNAPPSAQKAVVFDRRLKNSSHLFFDLSTGKNNVLTEAAEKRLEWYDFADIAAIDDVLARLGDQLSTSIDLIKLACETACSGLSGDYLEKLSDEGLHRRLNELLSSGISQNALMDEQVGLTLGEVVRRRIVLNDIVAEKLSGYLEKATSRPLIDTGSAYAAMTGIVIPAAVGMPAGKKAKKARNSIWALLRK
ncbi:MAG: hypothetical protein FWG42_05490 [Clostridiales bacterium]|nr:hypothetical protein [Clostridiales bacterium]